MKKIILIISYLVIFLNNGIAQTTFCSWYEADQKAERENPDALKAKQELDEFTSEYISKKEISEIVYIIPVVFHVLHNYGSENISKEQILDAVRILNEDFRKLNPDTTDIIPEFQGIAANSNIEFRLARIDPNGNCTDGIVRVVTPMTYNADDDSKLESPAWPRNKYLNIWTVASIESGAAGYSYYPSSVSGSWGLTRDGVMILSTYTGSIETGYSGTSRALTHEVGHYINLPHPWGNSNSPGLSSNCTIDDGVGDTPNTIGHTSCNLYAVTCGTLDNVQNYMEYSYCCRMFTEGQKARMRAALNSSVSGRNNLWTQANLIATGTDDNYISQICQPQPEFTASPLYGCNGLTVQFYDLTWNTDTITSRNWTFPGGTPSSSGDENPVVTYDTEGSYNVTLSVSNPAGTNQVSRTDLIHVQNTATGETIPWNEGFEFSAFPSHPVESYKDWEIYGDGSILWQRITSVSASGNASLMYDNINNSAELTSTLVTPNLLLAGSNHSNYVKFKVAYAQIDGNSNDKLWIFLSSNCGASWALRYNKYGSNLATNGGVYTSNFIPGPGDWRQESFSLSAIFQNKPYLRIKFVATSGNGNNIFIDDINLDVVSGISGQTLSEKYGIGIYPNPVTNQSVIVFGLDNEETVSLELFDIVGKRLSTYSGKFNHGYHELLLNEIFNCILETGWYSVKVKIGESAEVLRIIKGVQ